MLDVASGVCEVETEFKLSQGKNSGFTRVLFFNKELNCIMYADDTRHDIDRNNYDFIYCGAFFEEVGNDLIDHFVCRFAYGLFEGLVRFQIGNFLHVWNSGD